MKRDPLLFPIDSNHESCTGWACTGHWDHQTFWWETECKEMKERADTEFEWNRNWPMPRLEHGLATLLWHWQSSGRSVEQLQAGQISNVCILRDCTHTSPIGGTITFLIRELIEKENNPVFNCPEQLNRWPSSSICLTYLPTSIEQNTVTYLRTCIHDYLVTCSQSSLAVCEFHKS